MGQPLSIQVTEYKYSPENQISENLTPENLMPENLTPENQMPENQMPENQTSENQTSDNQSVTENDILAVKTIKDTLDQQSESNQTNEQTECIKKLNKQIRILECRNRLLSELLKAEISNYDSLRKVADDLLLDNKMLRKKLEERKTDSESDYEIPCLDSDYEISCIDPFVILGMMSFV